jgi:hypothetical protein
MLTTHRFEPPSSSDVINFREPQIRRGTQQPHTANPIPFSSHVHGLNHPSRKTAVPYNLQYIPVNPYRCGRARSSIVMAVLKHLPFASTTTSLQASTYLLAVCLFSISFLVFLNSSISFVITDLLGIKDGVGNLVGTLGFVDELVALVACPFWGILSDRVGVRTVCVAGYTIVGLALCLCVQAGNVYPQLLIARMGFSVGGAAT